MTDMTEREWSQDRFTDVTEEMSEGENDFYSYQQLSFLIIIWKINSMVVGSCFTKYSLGNVSFTM